MLMAARISALTRWTCGNLEAAKRGERAKESPEPSAQVGKSIFRVLGAALYVVHNTVGS